MVAKNEASDEVHLALDFLEFSVEEGSAGVLGGELCLTIRDAELGAREGLLERVALCREFCGELVLLGAAFGEGLHEGFLRSERTFELGLGVFEGAELSLGVGKLLGGGSELLGLGIGEGACRVEVGLEGIVLGLELRELGLKVGQALG